MDQQVEVFKLPHQQAASKAKNLHKLLKAFSRCRQIRDTMPLQYMYTFLLVCLYPDHSVEQLADRAGVGQTVMSRHLRDIGPTNRHQQPGFGLVDVTFDPKDMRRHIYVLTPKGKLVARELAECLE
jgi:DNA-binding MarR family transcriptional regulator